MQRHPLPRRLILSALLAFAVSLALPASAPAGELRDLKAAGVLGERPDGYLGAVGQAPADALDLMRRTNRERRDYYQDIARRQGTTLQAVEAIVGGRLVNEAPSGTYVMGSGGTWMRK